MSLPNNFELFARDGGIYWGEQRVSIKGINWSGFETPDWVLHGLWSVNMNRLLEFIAEHFNAIRLPFSAELALQLDIKMPKTINFSCNPELKGLTSGQIMDRLTASCAEHGLLVMLDMHRLAAAEEIPELWYNDAYSEALVKQAWEIIVLRYRSCWNVFAVDLKNEPHGCATWGDGNAATDWRLAAERLGAAVLALNPSLLLFVEGVERCANAEQHEQHGCWWGGNLAAAQQAPVRLPIRNKLVYAPHVYGPDVYAQPYFSDCTFPSNMPYIWRQHFGHIKQDRLGTPVCPGEWGGWARPGSQDHEWQQAYAVWLIDNDITDSFYWCLNPNSGDTGGVLMDDWHTPVQPKLDILHTAHPMPTNWPRQSVQLQSSFAAGQCQQHAQQAPCPPADVQQPPHAHSIRATGGCCTFQAPCNRSNEARLVFGTVQVREVDSWEEGPSPCHQLEVKVTNTGSAEASNMMLMMSAAGQLQQCWNCEQQQAPVSTAGWWCFGFPDWLRSNGGLAPGAELVLGIIVKGAKPAEVRLQ